MVVVVALAYVATIVVVAVVESVVADGDPAALLPPEAVSHLVRTLEALFEEEIRHFHQFSDCLIYCLSVVLGNLTTDQVQRQGFQFAIHNEVYASYEDLGLERLLPLRKKPQLCNRCIRRRCILRFDVFHQVVE